MYTLPSLCIFTNNCFQVAFDDFVPTVQPEYDDLKRRSTPQEWKKLEGFWEDTVTKDWMKKVSTAKTAPSRNNASMVKHMSQIVTHFSELVRHLTLSIGTAYSVMFITARENQKRGSD
jgi:hypothetical protein